MSSILLVDDDEGMVETLADILTARDYAVSTADSGEAAVEQVRRSGFDVVLMDIKMPGLNGVEALRTMKAEGLAKRVIMMTAHMRGKLVKEAEEQSGFPVLPKPLDMERLLALAMSATS